MKPNGYLSLISRKGFSAFLGTQFLGALNDNLLKWVITFLVLDGLVRGASGNAGNDLQLISILFILPSLLFTGLAGYLADNFEKRRVLIATKVWEIGVMLLAWLALRSGSFQAQLGVLFLLATQFTFFGPAKYGVVPELVGDPDLSRANGLLEMSTFLAILLGSVLASPLFSAYKLRLDRVGAVLVAVAVAGSLMSLRIAPTPAPVQRAPFKFSLLWSEVVEGSRLLRADRRLWVSNLGAAYFWFQGVLFQLAAVLLGKQMLHLDEAGVTRLFMAMAVGIGAGSMLAGRWSGDKVELGLVPLGALGMGVCAVAVAWAASAHPGLVVWGMAGLGVSAGLYAVPLNALLQQKAEAGLKGRVLAASNFYSTLAIIAASVLLGQLNGTLGMRMDRVILLAGLGCFAMTAYLMVSLPEFLVRACLWLATHSLYRVRVRGQQHVPPSGAVLLVCQSTALPLGLLVQASIQRFVRFTVQRSSDPAKPLNWFLRAANAMPGSATPSDEGSTLALARQALKNGHVVCLFAEGAGTRSADRHPFKPSLERILDGLDAPMIPVQIDGLAGAPLRFQGGRFRWTRPQRLPHPVTLTFGPPLAPDLSSPIFEAEP